MAKQVRRATSGAIAGRAPPVPQSGRRAAPPDELPHSSRSAPGGVRSDPMRLVDEVARLEGELAAMRARVTELEACAELDPLTEVMNRRGFERELKRAASFVERYGGNAALIYLDLDGFKPINDRHGHAAGDAILRAVAQTLSAAVRASDIVARLGGDEFAVLLWNLDGRNALAKAGVLEQAIACTNVDWRGARLAVGASAGVAELTSRDRPGDVVSRADAAMYVRKQARRCLRQ